MTQNSTTCSAARKPAASAKWLVAPCLAACLCACGGGGNSSSSNPADNTPTNPEAPYTVDLRQGHLLSDTELKTPPIASASGLSAPTPDEQAWLAENHRPIRSISFDGDFSDIEFLAQELEGKRIVQLGESSHGTAEFSAVKVRVIKYLHEQLAYNVIAFESSIAGCHIQDQDLDLHPPKPRVGVECAFGVWNTDDLNELARYIHSTRQTATPLRLAGFDIQQSSTLDSNDSLLGWISPVLDRIRPELTNPAREAIVNTDSDLRLLYICQKANQPSCPAFDNLAAAHYQRLGEISAQLHALVDATPLESPDREEVLFVWFAIDSLAGNLRLNRRSLDADWGYAAVRDALMAENVTRLAELAYPNEKLIVWAHNAHISALPDSSNNPAMGSYLRARWGNELASIGLFMLRGVTANNNRSAQAIKSPLPGSLEAYTYTLRVGALYLRVPNVDAAGAGDNWLHRPIPSYYWGATEQTDTMTRSYDGLIIIDRSTMPHYN
ncbi:MAG: erythromycin esterase family protein [Dokdonella sp.]